MPPPPPTWWKANRHRVFLCLGLAAGFWVAVKFGATPATCLPGTTPSPTHSPASTASPTAHAHQGAHR